MKRYRIKVEGKVQGVFFRASTQEKAEELGLKGWVKNEQDGSVLIEAEGDEDKLKEFLSWCQEGPERAKVERVQHESIQPKHAEAFEVRR